MKKIRIFAAVSILGLCAMAAPAMAEDVTLNALFMKQAGYSEEDVTAMTQAFTESTGIQVNPTFVAYEELAPKILTSAQSGGIIKVCTGSASGTPVAYIEIPAGGSMQEITTAVSGLSGKTNLNFVFNSNISMDSWELS